MKKIYAIGFSMMACCGCANVDDVPEEHGGADTDTSMPQPPPVRLDTGGNICDTIMYRRSPIKINDAASKAAAAYK